MNSVIGLSLGRIILGAAALAKPDLAAGALQVDGADPQVRFIARLFGSREVAVGALTLLTRGRAQHRTTLGLGVLIDGADVAAAALAAKEGALSRSGALTFGGVAASAAGTGLLALLRRR